MNDPASVSLNAPSLPGDRATFRYDWRGPGLFDGPGWEPAGPTHRDKIATRGLVSPRRGRCMMFLSQAERALVRIDVNPASRLERSQWSGSIAA